MMMNLMILVFMKKMDGILMIHWIIIVDGIVSLLYNTCHKEIR